MNDPLSTEEHAQVHELLDELSHAVAHGRSHNHWDHNGLGGGIGCASCRASHEAVDTCRAMIAKVREQFNEKPSPISPEELEQVDRLETGTDRLHPDMAFLLTLVRRLTGKNSP